MIITNLMSKMDIMRLKIMVSFFQKLQSKTKRQVKKKRKEKLSMNRSSCLTPGKMANDYESCRLQSTTMRCYLFKINI